MNGMASSFTNYPSIFRYNMQYQCKQSPSMGMIDDIKKTYEVQKYLTSTGKISNLLLLNCGS